MTKPTAPKKPAATNRKRYSPEYKADALKLAERVGVAKAAAELKVPQAQLYNWRKSAEQKTSSSEREQKLADENARLKRGGHHKKGRCVLRERPQVKYAFIENNRPEFSVRAMCRVMAVSPSGYYDWRGRPPSLRQQRQAARDEQVAQAFAKAKARSGARRLRDDLATDESRPDRKTIGASLARQQLRAKAARKFMATTNSRHGLPVAENLLAQDFTASGPNQKWAGDITYLHTDEGWLYLAVIIDLYSRRVIGWSMGERITAELACKALTMALSQRGYPREVIVHSDRGSQYCSAQYQQLLNDHGLRCSMSGKGNCYDNACVESFFHSLKVEAIHGERFASRERMRETVFRYIEVDYNHWRRHSTLGNISPSAFEARMSS